MRLRHLIRLIRGCSEDNGLSERKDKNGEKNLPSVLSFFIKISFFSENMEQAMNNKRLTGKYEILNIIYQHHGGAL